MKKKLIVLLLALACVFTMAIGCTSVEESQTIKPEFSGSYDAINAFVTDEIEIPEVAYTEGSALTISVNDPSGITVEVVDSKFTVTQSGTYVITYSLELGGFLNELQISVIVVENTIKPTIVLNGENITSVLRGEEVIIATATATDAIENQLAVDVKVIDATGTEVDVADGKFTATVVGDYTVSYKTVDKYGNENEIVNTINCYKLPDPVAPVPENVANSFENEEESYIDLLNSQTAAYTVTRNTSDDNANGVKSGAYSLKISAVAGGTFNIVSEAIIGNNDLSDIGNLTIWVYNPLEVNCGFSIYKIILKDGSSVTINNYAVINAGEWKSYSVNLIDCGLTEEQLEKTYAIQVWSETAFTEAYIDDISYDLRSDYPVIGEVKDSTIAKLNSEYTVVIPTTSEGTELTYVLTDAEGNEVVITDGKWTPSIAGVYTLTYTATKNGHVTSATTTIIVADKPVITINGENEAVVTVEDEVTIATATAKDFFNNDIVVVTTVTDANNEIVTLIDGKFTATVIGTYTVKYYTVDTNGNENEIIVTIECKPIPVSKGDVPENVANSFETIEECYLELLDKNSSAYDVFQNSTNDNADGVRSGAYSLKVVLTGSGQFNFLSEVIKGSKDLSDIANLSFWVYNPTDAAQGISLFKTVFANGTAVKTEVYKKIPAKSWHEFKYDYLNSTVVTKEQMTSVFSIQFFGISEVYIDDISYDLRSDYPEIDEVEEAVIIKNNVEYTLNIPSVSEGTELTYVLTNAEGNEVVVTDGKWTPSIASVYTLTYTATKNGHVISATTTITVADKPVITINGENKAVVTVEDEVTVATATAKDFFNNEIAVVTTVTDANGAEVTLTDGKFTASVIGTYTVKYYTVDTNGNENEIIVTIECKPIPVSKGDVPENVANSFETVEECYLELLDKNSSAYDVFRNSTNDNADGVRSGAYSLKVVLTGSGNFNLLSEVITGNNDLSDIANLSFWVYNPKDTAQGMSIYSVVLKNGTSVKTEVYKSIPAKSWYEFKYDYLNSTAVTEEQMGSVFSINLWGVKEIYIDDISYDLRSDYPSDPVSKGDVPENVANSFETIEECYLELLDKNSSGYDVFRNSTNDNADGVRSGAYSLKVVLTGSGNFNLLSEVITGNNDLSDIANLSFWVYNPKDTAQGMSIYSVVFKNGTSVKTEVYKAIPAKSWHEFKYDYLNSTAVTEEQMGSVFSIQLWGVKEIYIDDISYDLRSDYEPVSKGEVPENVANSFETVEECYLELLDKNSSAYDVFQNSTNDNADGVRSGAYSLKVVLTGSGNFNLLSEVIVGSKDLSDIANLSFWIYNPTDTDQGISLFKTVFVNGTAVKTEVYKKIPAKSWHEFKYDYFNSTVVTKEQMASVFAIQFFGIKEVYIDDISYDLRSEMKAPEPENTALSFKAWANVTGTNVTINTNNEYVIDGGESLRLELTNGGAGWSRAQVSNWGKGITFTEDYNAITFKVYSTKATNVSFIIGTGNTNYTGQSYSKLIALTEGWNDVTICIDTDMSGNTIAIKNGIVFFGAQAVNTAYETGDPNKSAVNNDGAILYVDAVLATNVNIPDPEPENTAISFESFGAGFTATNIEMNTDPTYVKDGTLSLKMTLANGGKWSFAGYARWGKGITFTEDYNAITFSVYATQDVRVCFWVGAGGNKGSLAHVGESYSKGYSLKEGWNQVTINFDTDITKKTVGIKEGIVQLSAQAVKDTFVGPENSNNYAINNSGAVLYIDAVLAINVETPKQEPENTAISFESFGADFTATNVEMNTDPTYVKDGTLSLKMTLANISGKWSFAGFSRWGKGITFTEDYNAITLSVYATKAVRVCFRIGAGGNTGAAAYAGESFSKAYNLVEGWNEITINFDTDITQKTAPIKAGIVHFCIQAVNENFEGPAACDQFAVNNSGVVLYVDEVLATRIDA